MLGALSPAVRLVAWLDDADLDDRRRHKPYLLCEYAHAMGNGPGSLLDYRQILESSDRCMGGFVWEYIDHAIPTTDAAGVRIDGYGGDFGEAIHDGNFITDGLMFADRTPSPACPDAATPPRSPPRPAKRCTA